MGRTGERRVGPANVRAVGLDTIDAYVAEITTAVGGAERKVRFRDLALKSHERLFFERVPLDPGTRQRIQLSDEWRYASLARAWGPGAFG